MVTGCITYATNLLNDLDWLCYEEFFYKRSNLELLLYLGESWVEDIYFCYLFFIANLAEGDYIEVLLDSSSLSSSLKNNNYV